MKKILLLILFSILTTGLFADAKGDEIARKVDAIAKPEDSHTESVMVLIDKRNNRKVRRFVLFSKTTAKGINSLIKFLEPADVKGSGLLTIGNNKGNDEHRLYLTALRKTRKISNHEIGGSFMGSDLNYYDMEKRSFSDASYKYLRDENFKGTDCYILESYPTDPNAPYSKMQSWIDKSNYVTKKIVCYDKKNRKAKTIEMVEFTKIKSYYLISKMIVVNHLKSSKTLITNDRTKVDIGVKDEIFSIKNLTR